LAEGGVEEEEEEEEEEMELSAVKRVVSELDVGDEDSPVSSSSSKMSSSVCDMALTSYAAM
jgi:hypothetical protein